MASTVKNAFNEFMKDIVNLDTGVTKKARDSKENLLKNIDEFHDDDFFKLHKPYNIQFGSFARKTKCRELDDIDLMIGINAEGATYFTNSWDDVYITPSTSKSQIDCRDELGYLNSTKVINKFKKKLEGVREYSRSEIKKNGEAIVLNLISKDWSFDIVPCFRTAEEYDGRYYYLIPNGKGHWKKTNPILDRERIQEINQEKNGKVLELVRLVKRWNKTKNAKSMPSYLLEAIVLNYSEGQYELPECIYVRFTEALGYIADNIYFSVFDPKEIQGNINTLSDDDRKIISQKAKTDHDKAHEAYIIETEELNNKKAINKWREIFGTDFPEYE